MELTFEALVGAVMTLILGLLFKDMRTIVRERKEDSSKADLKAAEFKKEIYEKFIPFKDHELQCRNTVLNINAHITDEMKVLKKEILDAIKDNGAKK